MADMPGRATTIQMPRWIQLVGLPVLLVLLCVVAGAMQVDDYSTALNGQPGRAPAAATR